MKASRFIVIFLLISIVRFASAQNGRYFENIEGSSWYTIDINLDSSIIDSDEIGLRLWTDTYKSPDIQDLVLWEFNGNLTLKFYNKETNSFKQFLVCDYEHNFEAREITLIFNGIKVKYKHSTVSTGSFVLLSRMKK